MISFKRTLNSDVPQSTLAARQSASEMQSWPPESPQLALDVQVPQSASPHAVPGIFDCYRSALLAIGKSALRGFPALGTAIEKEFKRLENFLSENPTPESVLKAHGQVELLLEEWGEQTDDHLKQKTGEVMELIDALTRVAGSVGDRDHRHTSKFADLATHIEKIGDLENLAQIRTSLARRVAELKSSVDQMKSESEQLVTQLRAEVSAYENKLKMSGQPAPKDEVTGAANRKSAEEKIEALIAGKQAFCILLLDLNGFKQINARYGQLAGDQLLNQFAQKLKMNVRPSDLVGRWGGDEFIVVMPGDAAIARCQVEHLTKAVMGKCTIKGGASGPIEVQLDAALGLAQWRAGQTIKQLVAQADGLLYQEKRHAKAANRYC